MNDNLDKKRVALDIVFLLDCSASMQACLPTIVGSLTHIVAELGTAASPLEYMRNFDCRFRVVGYRDKESDGSQWWIDNPFTSDVAQVGSQLAALEAKGGTDGPRSLLDAMSTVAEWPSAEKGSAASPDGWRHRHDAGRLVLIFTDADTKPDFTAPDGARGQICDVMNAYHESRLQVCLFAPETEQYMELAGMDALSWEPIGVPGPDSARTLKDVCSESAIRDAMRPVFGRMMVARDVEEPPVLCAGNSAPLHPDQPPHQRVDRMNISTTIYPLRVDVVLLVATPSTMREPIAALAELSKTLQPDPTPFGDGYAFTDWRFRVAGFHHRGAHPSRWWVDHPFTCNMDEISAQLSGLKTMGGPEPLSLLDALYRISQWPSAKEGALPEPNEWSYRRDASRWVAVFTDASFEPEFTVSDGTQGDVVELIHACHAIRLKVRLFAPDAPGYADLSCMNGLEWDPIGDLSQGVGFRLLAEAIRHPNFATSLLGPIKEHFFIEFPVDSDPDRVWSIP